MLFFTQFPGCPGPTLKECKCGRKFTALDWLDLPICGLMDSGDDYTMLDLRHCPCRSTIAVEVPLVVDPHEGLPQNFGTRAIRALRCTHQARIEEVYENGTLKYVQVS